MKADGDLQAQLADAERRVALAERRVERLIQWVAGITAELYCMEYGVDARRHGGIGIEGFRFPGPSTRGAYDTLRAEMIKALSIEA